MRQIETLARLSNVNVPLSPQKFLRRLGLRRNKIDYVSSGAYWRDIAHAGGDPHAPIMHGPFSPQAYEAYFATEEMARRTLSFEYDWFVPTLETLLRLTTALGPPRRIADLGGGTGIVSLYLAACHPECEAFVYDHSPRALELGRKWAQERNLGNVHYVQATYREITERSARGDHDLVLFFRGVDLRVPAPRTGDLSPWPGDDCPIGPKPRADALEALTAMARLLAPDGVGLIGCTWSGFGLIQLFEAARRAGLGVEWRLSRYADCPGIAGDCIFLRPGMPHLGRNSREGARAYVDSATFDAGPYNLDQAQIDDYLPEFQQGNLLLAAEGATGEGLQQVRLWQRDHRLMLEISAQGRPRQCNLHSLAGVGELLEQAQDHVDDWPARSMRNHRLKLHPRLRILISRCERQTLVPARTSAT